MAVTLEDSGFTELDRDLEEFRQLLRRRVRSAVRTALGDIVGLPALHLVGVLSQNGPMSPSELAARLEIRTSTMTAHLDRLEELGWAARESGPVGPSRLRVVLTADGARAHERYVEARRRVVRDLLAPLAPEQMQDLARALRALVAAQNLASEGEE